MHDILLVGSVSRSVALRFICVGFRFPLILSSFVFDVVIYGWTRTSQHTAPHAHRCFTPLTPWKKKTETSQQCINSTGFTTVWPTQSALWQTHTESITEECDGFLWDVWFGLFWRCSLGRHCHGDRDSLTKMAPKMGFKGVCLAAWKHPCSLSNFFLLNLNWFVSLSPDRGRREGRPVQEAESWRWAH